MSRERIVVDGRGALPREYEPDALGGALAERFGTDAMLGPAFLSLASGLGLALWRCWRGQRAAVAAPEDLALDVAAALRASRAAARASLVQPAAGAGDGPG